MVSFLIAHRTVIALLGAYLFSGAMSTMPPLPANCGWFSRWAHDWLQFVGANWNKVRVPGEPER